MKKIRLNVANLEGTEILSREQLKSVFGGSGSGSGSDSLSSDSGSGCAANHNAGCKNSLACVIGTEAGICKTVSGTCDCTKV